MAACARHPSAAGWAGLRRPPAGADSAAVEAWAAAHARRCPGGAVRVVAPFAVADSAGGPFRVRDFLEGLKCPAAERRPTNR
jgi:hypothetical protein